MKAENYRFSKISTEGGEQQQSPVYETDDLCTSSCSDELLCGNPASRNGRATGLLEAES